jgi:sugar/nucleoside kinase (ribokinase family)
VKDFDLFAIGNALVDYEIEVSEAALVSAGVEKGVMTLVDEPRQKELLNTLDGKLHNRACGGSAANSVIAASSLGLACHFTCLVAADEPGDFYLRDLTRHGVEFNNLNQFVAGTTGKCLVMVTPDADRTMNTYLGKSAEIGASSLDIEQLKKSKIVYVEGYLVSSDDGFALCEATLKAAKTHDIPVAISLSDPNMVKFFKERFLSMLAYQPKWIFCNAEEAIELTGATDIETAQSAMMEYTQEAIITLGPDGVVIVNQNGSKTVKGCQAKAIDTNGAGDMFAGTFLAAILKGASQENAAKVANIGAAEVVSQYGPRLNSDSMAEFNQVFQSRL